MKDILKNKKFRNPYFWLSIVGLIFSASGIEFSTLTSWQLFGEALLTIFNNPVSTVAVITALIGIFNDNSTSGLDPIKTKKDKENKQ